MKMPQCNKLYVNVGVYCPGVLTVESKLDAIGVAALDTRREGSSNTVASGGCGNHVLFLAFVTDRMPQPECLSHRLVTPSSLTAAYCPGMLTP
jgi:hypothetical protein